MEDLDAAVIPGVDGITLPKCSGRDDVKRLDFMLTDLEKKRGLPVGGIRMAILIETAIGVAARAAGLAAEDAPFPNYRDSEAFEANCRSGAQFGFEGRQIIHPRQIPIAHKI